MIGGVEDVDESSLEDDGPAIPSVMESTPQSPPLDDLWAKIDNYQATLQRQAEEPLQTPQLQSTGPQEAIADSDTSAQDPHQLLEHPYRGITNANGTACHTSSALQLLFHCFPAFREALLDLAPISAECHAAAELEGQYSEGEGLLADGRSVVEKEFVHQLAWFFHLLARGEDVLAAAKAKAGEANDDDGATWEGASTAGDVVAITAVALTRAPTEEEVEIAQQEKYEGGALAKTAIEIAAAESAPEVVALTAEGIEESNSHGEAEATQAAAKSISELDDKNGAQFKAFLADDAASHASASAGRSKKERRRKGKKSRRRRERKREDGAAAGAALGVAAANVSFDETDGAGEALASPQSTVEADHTAASPSSPSSASRKSGRSHKSKLKGAADINSIQRQAISAFMRRARAGEGSAGDWERLVRVMREENREQFMGALGMVLQSHEKSGEREEEEETGGEERPPNSTEMGNLGGGRGGSVPSPDAVDPAPFYAHLSGYTSALDPAAYVNVDSVSDAAMVFRCLVSSLEVSVGREVARMDGELDIAEVDEWNREGREGDRDQENVNDTHFLRQKRLKASIDQVKDAMWREWSGSLVSRIVGTFTTVESNATASFSFREAEAEVTTEPKTVTITTTIQRTKKNGSIERPIPVPFPLPVVQQSASLTAHRKQGQKGRGNQNRQYFFSLDQSLRSVTVEPNPIRGYDWRGLMKREGAEGVVEETFVRQTDQDGNEIVHPEEEEQAEAQSNEPDKSREVAIGDGALDDDEGNGETAATAQDHDDDLSVLSSASRSIACQTDFGYDTGTQTSFDEVGNVVHEGPVKTIEVSPSKKADNEVEDEKKDDAKDDESPASANGDDYDSRPQKFAIERDAAYKAAVAALTRAPKVQRSREELLGSSAEARRDQSSSREGATATTAADNQRGRMQKTSSGHVRGTSIDSRSSHVSIDSRRSLPIDVNGWFDRHRGMKLQNPSGQSRSSLRDSGSATSSPREATDGDEGRTISNNASPNNFWASLPGFATPRGMEVGPGAGPSAQNTAAQDRVAVSYLPSPMGSPGDNALSSDSDDSGSQESSTVDSHVSSVDTDSTEAETEETHSSAIDTPSDIEKEFDDLSLGSFTDDSLPSHADEKKDESEVVGTDTAPTADTADATNGEPAQDVANASVAPEDHRTSPSAMDLSLQSKGSTTHSAITDSVGHELSSSGSEESSSASSSSSSSSSSYTSSTDTSSSSSSDDTSTSSSVENQCADADNAKAIPLEGSSDASSADSDDDEVHRPQLQPRGYNREEWVTRKETRLCHPLPRSLVFHLKRFEYSPKLGRVEKLPGEMRVPEVLDTKVICLELGVAKKYEFPSSPCCYQYNLTGAIVHVDPIEEEEEAVYGEPSEGHYVAFVCSPESKSLDNAEDPQDKANCAWMEFDDETARAVSSEKPALEVISGCSTSNEKERRYATLLVYSRSCQCK